MRLRLSRSTFRSIGQIMDYYDDLETRDPTERERQLFAALPGQITHAQANAPGFAALLRGVEPHAVTSRTALAKLPIVRKSALRDLQRQQMPFGGLSAAPLARLGRVYASPGPIYDPEGRG